MRFSLLNNSFQRRFWGTDYIDNKTDYTNKGIDQLSNLITEIKKES